MLCWSCPNVLSGHVVLQVVVVQWKFLQFNVLEGHSALFGTSSWHRWERTLGGWSEGAKPRLSWCRYFTQDAPSLLFTFLPLCLLGVWQSSHSTRTPFWMALWNIAVLSCLGHKEHRFLLPVLPIASLYAGESIHFYTVHVWWTCMLTFYWPMMLYGIMRIMIPTPNSVTNTYLALRVSSGRKRFNAHCPCV